MRISLAAAILLTAVTAVADDWTGKEWRLMQNLNIQRLHEIQTRYRRASRRLPAQELNGQLCKMAQEWSEKLVGDYEASGSPDCGDSLWHSNYGLTENMACGSRSARGTMNQWIGSGRHYVNLLSGYKQVGFGIAEAEDGTRYWTSIHGSGFKVYQEEESEVSDDDSD